MLKKQASKQVSKQARKKTTNDHSGIQTEGYLTHGTTVKRPSSGVIARILIILGTRFGGRKGSWVAHIHVTSKETLLERLKKGKQTYTVIFSDSPPPN